MIKEIVKDIVASMLYVVLTLPGAIIILPILVFMLFYLILDKTSSEEPRWTLPIIAPGMVVFEAIWIIKVIVPIIKSIL